MCSVASPMLLAMHHQPHLHLLWRLDECECEHFPSFAGVVVYSMSDVPLGFGVTAKATSDCRKMDPSGVVVFHQSDVGEYLRSEEEL